MKMKRILYAAIILVSFAWFPHSLERIHRLGYDFPIYYAAAHHQFVQGWVYSDHLWVLFSPLALFDMDTAFAGWYALSVLAWLEFAKRYPVLSILAAYPMLLSLELGQIAPLLAWLCLSLPGALLAMAVKPYLVVFVILQAIRRAVGIYQQWSRDLGENLLQDEPHSLNPTMGD
jgi:hypothetical protein